MSLLPPSLHLAAHTAYSANHRTQSPAPPCSLASLHAAPFVMSLACWTPSALIDSTPCLRHGTCSSSRLLVTSSFISSQRSRLARWICDTMTVHRASDHSRWVDAGMIAHHFLAVHDLMLRIDHQSLQRAPQTGRDDQGCHSRVSAVCTAVVAPASLRLVPRSLQTHTPLHQEINTTSQQYTSIEISHVSSGE